MILICSGFICAAYVTIFNMVRDGGVSLLACIVLFIHIQIAILIFVSLNKSGKIAVGLFSTIFLIVAFIAVVFIQLLSS